MPERNGVRVFRKEKDMLTAQYIVCPKCDFPAVLSGDERSVTRRCRQCGGVFLPAACGGSADGRVRRCGSGVEHRRRRALTARLRRRLWSMIA